MPFPSNVNPHPDVPLSGPRLGAQERAVIDALAQRAGLVVTREELLARVRWSPLTARRLEAHIERIRDVLGADAVLTVPRRGWIMRRPLAA